LSPKGSTYSVFRWTVVGCACGLVGTLDVMGRKPARLMEHLYYFWGWAVNKKMSHPGKSVPEKLKSWLYGLFGRWGGSHSEPARP